jgi:hypothetical protein
MPARARAPSPEPRPLRPRTSVPGLPLFLNLESAISNSPAPARLVLESIDTHMRIEKLERLFA